MMNSLVILLTGFTLVYADDEAFESFVTGNYLFTVSLYKELMLKDKNSNFFVSPFAAATVLALIQSESKDKTAEEIRRVLHLPKDNEEFESAISAAIKTLQDGQAYTLHTANKIYVKKGTTIREDFRKVATELYECGLEYIDFSRNAEAARKINKWVQDQTNNTIQNLFNLTDFDDRTNAVLTSTPYFKADWSLHFLPGNTEKSDFYITPEDVIKVDTMHFPFRYNRPFLYFESTELDAKFLQVNFKDKDACMIFVLPKQKQGLAALENQIKKVLFTDDFRRHIVNIALPKFKIETMTELGKMLQHLGVKSIFSEDAGDMSGVAGKKDDLLIDKIVQKTFISINEEGLDSVPTTSAALHVPRSGLQRRATFIANHPFMFYVKIKDAIVFIGRVTKPIH